MNLESTYSDLAKKISDYGWAHMGIISTDLMIDGFSFDYTIGLTEQDLPELVICAPIPHPIANQIFSNVIGSWQRDGFSTGINDDILQGMRVNLIEVDAEEACKEFTIQAREYYRHSDKMLRVVQIVLPDEKGKLPGESGYSMYQQTLIPSLSTKQSVTGDLNEV